MKRRWILRRLVASLITLFIALVINFAIPRAMPGDIIGIMSAGASLDEDARQGMIKRFGLDAPLWKQFSKYFINVFRLDFGFSFKYYPKSVTALLLETLPWTLFILLTSVILQGIIGYTLGVISAWKHGTRTDDIIQLASLAILSSPLFWIAMVFLYVFGFKLDWFPLSGAITAGATYEGTFDKFFDILRHAALPIFSLTIAQFGMFQLVLRNTMVGVLKELYIQTAEAKGLSEMRIKHRHAARNALLPMITFLGVSFAISIGASVYVETVFSYPGVGRLIFQSVVTRDYPVLQGCFFVFAIICIGANFFIDVLYRFLDPRIGG